MSASFYDLLKYAATGIASPSMTYYDRMRSSTLMGGAVQTLTGIPPLTFKADGTPLISWSMKGNGSQSGTPTPDNPVMPEFVGARTAQLFDASNLTYGFIETNGSISPHSNFVVSDYLPLDNGISFNATFSGTKTIIYAVYNANHEFVSGSRAVKSTVPFSIPAQSGVFVRVNFSSAAADVDTAMANTGDTALPYEPYGYKIPISCGGENLFDKAATTVYDAYFNGAGNWLLSSDSKSIKFPCSPNTQYTISVPNALALFRIYESADADIEPAASSSSVNRATAITRNENIRQYTFTTSSTAKVLLFQGSKGTVEEWLNGLMLNLGSTAKPYAPYSRQTTPVYLGQASTVRKIRKLVLTGAEDFLIDSYLRFSIPVNDIEYSTGSRIKRSYCSHYECLYHEEPYDNNWNNVYYQSGRTLFFHDRRFTNVTDFKAFLAAQYANGTPVTLWYVLATPQNAIINEPLSKIGDYADELHSTDAGVTIPTAKGANTLTVETELQPSEMSITYKG